MADLFWLSDEQWAVLEPFMPQNQPGARRVMDRGVISGIVHVLKSGGRWRDCPRRTARTRRSTTATTGGPAGASGAPCWRRWPRQGGSPKRRLGLNLRQGASLAHRRQRGAKGAGHRTVAGRADHQGPRPRRRPWAACRCPPHAGQCLGREDRARRARFGTGPPEAPRGGPGLRCQPSPPRPEGGWHHAIIPGRRSRKRPIQHDERRYKERWRIEAAFCRLKDFRRVATRYDKLAANFASAVALAAVIAFWC
jgi:transposase